MPTVLQLNSIICSSPGAPPSLDLTLSSPPTRRPATSCSRRPSPPAARQYLSQSTVILPLERARPPVIRESRLCPSADSNYDRPEITRVPPENRTRPCIKASLFSRSDPRAAPSLPRGGRGSDYGVFRCPASISGPPPAPSKLSPESFFWPPPPSHKFPSGTDGNLRLGAF